MSRGSYVDPHAGRIRFGTYADRWQQGRTGELATRARDASIMRTHVIPQWKDFPLNRIDHSAAQKWVADLGARGLSAATISQCVRLASGVFRSAVRDRLLSVNPCEGVKVPPHRKKDTDDRTITRIELTEQLLPAVPDRYRALVALAGGTGLRWGECVGLRWNDAVDLEEKAVRVIRTAVEVAGTVTTKGFPKTRAGRRSVPLPEFVIGLLTAHKEAFPAGPAGEVFTNTSNGPLRRTLFRSRVWRPSLVRAGLLGRIDRLGHFKFRAVWRDVEGIEWTAEFTTEREAVAHIAVKAHGGLRFHDLRHSYATWLVAAGVPVNDVKEVMGHERTSTTLNLYTHGTTGRAERVLGAFADDSLTPDDEEAI